MATSRGGKGPGPGAGPMTIYLSLAQIVPNNLAVVDNPAFWPIIRNVGGKPGSVTGERISVE
jgi:hypothetical protein